MSAPPVPSSPPPAPPPPAQPGDPLPHFGLPFRFSGPAAAWNEQDSLDEVADCLLAILVCPQGFRAELPAFGQPDPTFLVPGPSPDAIRAAVSRWEPRAVLLLDTYPDLIDALVAHVEAYVQVRSEE